MAWELTSVCSQPTPRKSNCACSIRTERRKSSELNAPNPVIDALRRNGEIEFIHVRHEEYGVFAAVADSYLSGNPVAVCGTAGPGVTHLFNGLMDARKEGAAIIAIAGDIEIRLIDTAALEELNPYKCFDSAYLYVGRVVNPEQVRAVLTTAIMTAVVDKGPMLISMPGDIAAAKAPDHYIGEITEKHHCHMVSHSDVYSPDGRSRSRPQRQAHR
jgi:thiamine pyrophosphate-dependent acetolactate synthase large subunit-like protein